MDGLKGCVIVSPSKTATMKNEFWPNDSKRERRKQSAFKYLNVLLAVMINDNRNQVAIGAENEIGEKESEIRQKKGPT